MHSGIHESLLFLSNFHASRSSFSPYHASRINPLPPSVQSSGKSDENIVKRVVIIPLGILCSSCSFAIFFKEFAVFAEQYRVVELTK